MDTDESTNETEPSGTTADENPNNVSSSSKDSIENLDAIKKFIEEHDKGQEERNKRTEEQLIQDVNDKMDIDEVKESNDGKKEDDTSVASSVMDMILTETENKLDGKKDVEKVDKQIISRGIGNNSMSLSVGTKVEAKDFGEIWHPAVITELDYDELEVLVHYDDDIKKHDEWINVNSPRLRPHTGTAPKLSTTATPAPKPSKPAEEVKEEELVKEIKEEPKEIKAEEKIKPVFVEGEKCLARWRDNRRFIATIHKDLGDGKYEIIFDDGFHWTCTISRLHKWKSTGKMESLSVDISQSPATGPQSPIHFGSGPSTLYPNPAFHTHLFDPTRDYLSSKSERREMKRKLNIKEIFNIGQKKQKMQKTEKEKPKVPVEKKPRILKRSLKLKRRKAEVKAEIPDAVASIIGTLKEEISPETESEPKPVVETVTDIVKTENDPVMVVDTENAENVDEDTLNSDNDVHEPLSEGDNSEGDPVMYEEVKLEKFDGPNNDHEEVIDKIKEAISKLEDGLNESLKADSPKVDLFKVGSPKVDSYKIGSPKVDSYKIGSPKVDSYKIGSPKVDYFKVGSPKVDLYNVGSPKVDSYKIGSPKVDSFKVGSPKVDLFKLGSPKVELFRVDSPKLDSPKLNSPRIEGIPTPEPETSDTPTTDIEIITVNPENVEESSNTSKELPRDEEVKLEVEKKVKKVPSKMKKGKKLRILQEKKVKKQVEKVKCELEEMKRQFEEMRKQMLMKTEELSQKQEPSPTVMPESFLLPGEWCCHWVNGQPVGNVSEIEAELKHDAQGKPALPRRSVQVEDKRLPPGWTKHMVRRSVGNSAGKWDVVLVSPENKRFHTKTDMRHYLEANPNEALQQYEHALMDFGVHLKLARRMGWIVNTPDGIAEAPATILPAGTMSSSSPLVKRSKLGIKKKMMKEKRRPIKLKLQRGLHSRNYNSELMNTDSGDTSVSQEPVEPLLPLEDGYVYVGSLKVQVIENLLRCPAEGCYKNFRNNTLIQMHIKHYHRELRKQLGATPKVLDLASARSTPAAPPRERRPHKVKTRAPRPLPPPTVPAPSPPLAPPAPPSPPRAACPAPPSLDSPKLRQALVHKPVKRPRVLLPVKRPEPELAAAPGLPDFAPPAPATPDPAPLDFETAISTHTVTKPLDMKKKKDKRPTSFAQFPRSMSEDEDWLAINSDDLDTRSSFPRSGTPDSKVMDGKMAAMSSESANEDQRDSNLYTYTETGERVKIVHMKREEIINCHCGFREEDGLMVQCELCLCWQHALCHNILKESDVPDKYTCSICLNPRRGRRSKRFIHDQDRMYEGVVCGGSPCGALRRSHDLSGNLLRLDDALHALRVKYYVATKKDHPKLYLWAKDWEQAEITYTQEKLNSDYSDLSIMINGMDKENMPMKPDDVNMQLDMRASPSEELEDRYNPQRDIQLGSQSLLSGLLSSPGGATLDLPISTSELERLAKSVQAEAAASDWQRVYAPQPEAAIENDACRERLLKHIQRCQALIDTRLDSIEAQVAELESQDPSFGEHYETAEFYPRTKQTIQMLMRDLDTMEELGGIT